MRKDAWFLCVVAVAAGALPAFLATSSASAANTWAGTWNSDFGRMILDAGGSGSYEGFSPGTVSGNVEGNVNEGTWNQPGDPPKSGTFKFTMGSDGLSFTGDWAYDSGGCGTACGWNGSCIAGPCLENGTPTPAEQAAVKRLQDDLRRVGLYTGPVDGNESSRLTDAVRSFQRHVGLPMDGRCDEDRCRAALRKARRLDDPKRKPGAVPKAPRTVKELQRDLRALGFYSGPVDGRYDDGVTDAVKRFQRDAGIAANGKCQSRCQFAIVRALTQATEDRAALRARARAIYDRLR